MRTTFIKIVTAFTFITLALSLTACSLNKEEFNKESLNAPLSLPSDYIMLVENENLERRKDQILLVQLSNYLETQAETVEQKAAAFYELGIVYDRLGLEDAARTMFMNAIVHKPDFAPAYNFMGIYLTLDGRLSEAYDAFDAALELAPEDVYANLNRGISLYYGNRSRMGVQDMEIFYKADTQDPYRILWLYILEQDYLGKDKALQNLKVRFDKVKDPHVRWGFSLVELFLGNFTESDIIDLLQEKGLTPNERVERLCEGYYYLGKYFELNGDDKRAYDYYLLALSTDKKDFLEYRYARVDIRNIKIRHNLVPRLVEPQVKDLDL